MQAKIVARFDALTEERDEAVAEADPELLTIAWMDGSHRSAKAARDEIKRLTDRLSAMQEAIDEAVRTLRISQGRLALTGILEGVRDAVSLLEPFTTKPEPEPEVDPLSHEQAIDALCGCAATVTVLSYQEAIEGYFKLRGLSIP